MKHCFYIALFVALGPLFTSSLLAQVEDPVTPAAEVVAKAQPASQAAAEEPQDKDSPVAVPPLAHYAKLWTESLFTTRALPPPEAPAGPTFTDSLSLSGTYEDNGKMTAVLMDKTTSNTVLAYIGEDNAEGFRIVKVVPGDSPDQMKLQLQKGTTFGWVSFGAESEAPPAAGAGGGRAPGGLLGTRNNTIPNPPGNRIGGMRNVQQPPSPPPQPMPSPVMQAPPAAAPPSLRGGMPQVAPAVSGDIPLPPP